MIPDEVRAAAESVASQGFRPVVISTTDSSLPFVVFSAPTIAQLSQYTAKASDASIGPLVAAVGLARMSVAYPSLEHLNSVLALKPFAVMRAVQALLADFGLSARAEKKSL